MINKDSACSKPGTEKKDNKPDAEKKNNKPDTKKKDNKPDTKKKDNKPDIKKKDNKSDIKKKDNKPDIKKKDNKPDTSKNNNENRANNRIKYEIQDIAKYRKVLIKMIKERMNMLDLMQFRLAESIEDTNIYENMNKFDRLCHASRINIIPEYKETISGIYAVNVALECLHDSIGNRIWPKGISYTFIPIINYKTKKDYDIKVNRK